MNKQIITMIMLTVCGIWACGTKTSEEQKTAKPTSVAEHPHVKQKQSIKRENVDQMAFVEYLDDGDYFQLVAKKGDSTFSFINESDTRNLNRGDQIRVTWKAGTITLAGDNDAEVPAQLLLSVKKIGDGQVSSFRRTYGKKLKYAQSSGEEFTSSYVDKVYLLVEYYLTETKNPLLKAAIKNRDEVTYSIESKERNDRSYKVIGIAPVGSNGSNIIQWLYVDEENNDVYEYDSSGDKLVAFD